MIGVRLSVWPAGCLCRKPLFLIHASFDNLDLIVRSQWLLKGETKVAIIGKLIQSNSNFV